MISLTRREFDAVSNKLLEACFGADRRDRPLVHLARQQLKAVATDRSAPQPLRRVLAPVH